MQILLEKDSITFRFSFSWETKDRVKGLGARFNPNTKTWYLPKSEATKVVPLLSEGWQADEEVLAAIAQERTKLALDLGFTPDLTVLEQPLPNGRRLYAHQKEAVRWAIRCIQTKHRGGILALDMGLGKTMVSLVTAKLYKQKYPNWRVIVVCPTSLKQNWLREAEGVGIKIEVFSWQKQPQVPTEPYFFIADEAHYAQSGTKTKRGKAFLDLCKNSQCSGKLLLTGTPMKNGRPINLLPLLQAINHPVVANRRQYEERYCAARPTKYCSWDTSGASNLKELQGKIRDFVFRRTKKQCLDLPRKIRVFVPAEVSGTALEEYKTARRTAINAYNPAKNGAALVLMMALRQASSKAKIPQAISMAEELLEQGEQVVIFTEFVDTAKALHQALGGCLLIGETPQTQRQALVDKFQSGREKVFISTSGAGGVGITLTASQTVILVDRALTTGDVVQCEDRCHRIGAKGSVSCYWLQYEKVDEKIDRLLAQKQERIDLVLEGKRKTMRGVSGNPLDYLEELAQELAEELA